MIEKDAQLLRPAGAANTAQKNKIATMMKRRSQFGSTHQSFGTSASLIVRRLSAGIDTHRPNMSADAAAGDPNSTTSPGPTPPDDTAEGMQVDAITDTTGTADIASEGHPTTDTVEPSDGHDAVAETAQDG